MKKVHCKALIFLIALQGTTFLLFYSWYSQHLQIFSSNKGKVHVLLLSSWRSGSSFLGQVFSQHPSVFYLMEPGWHVWTKMQKCESQILRMSMRNLLQSLYKCDFSKLGAYLPENPRVSSLFMWTESKALCSRPACPLTARNETQCYQKCDVQGLQKVEKACSTYSHVALKEVRFFELESLYPLLKDPNLDLRIVHLVRDPRAILRSREESAASFVLDNTLVLEHKSIGAAEVQYKVLEAICQSHLHISETAIMKPPLFLKGRYKMVRYEDIAQNPLKEVNDIYQFVGLEMTKQMGKWIYKKTHGNGKGSAAEAFQIISRNATQVSQAWRTMLPHHKVRRVQEVCREAMGLLGYRTVQSEKEQKALDIDLLLPLAL